MVRFLCLFVTIYETHCTELVKKVCYIKSCLKKIYCYNIFQFSQCVISIDASFLLNIVWYRI